MTYTAQLWASVDIGGFHRRRPKPLCPALLHVC